MMYRKVTLKEVPQEGLTETLKGRFVERAEAVFLLTRDDGTPVLVFGTFRFTPISQIRTVWMIPYAALRARDFRGMMKLFKLLRRYTPQLRALVREDHPAAIRVAEHLGGRYVQWTNEERLYEWL